MNFLHPQLLWLLAIIPLIVVFYILTLKKRHASMRISSFYRLIGGGTRVYMRHIPFILEMIAASFMIVTLARPRDMSKINEKKIEGIDIMLTLDASGSMLAMDLEPNRFEAAKEVAASFIDKRPNDNIGLVVFAGESFTRCPLTTDHPALLERLKSVQTGILEDGTAIGMGIATACNGLKNSKAKSKIVVLLTDGTNNVGSITPNTAASIAAGLGIRIYTIGVGTLGEAPYPRQTAFGTVVDYVKADIDEPSLKHIAQETGGNYYRATDNESLERIYQEIDKLEKSKLLTKNVQVYEELYFGWTMAAFFLLILSLILRATLYRTNP